MIPHQAVKADASSRQQRTGDTQRPPSQILRYLHWRRIFRLPFIHELSGIGHAGGAQLPAHSGLDASRHALHRQRIGIEELAERHPTVRKHRRRDDDPVLQHFAKRERGGERALLIHHRGVDGDRVQQPPLQADRRVVQHAFRARTH